jgi:hypothetical protein
MKPLILLALALSLPPMGCAGIDETAEAPRPATNVMAVPAGWLRLPSQDLVLDLHQDSLEYGARQDAGEFLASVLNLLLRANYTVRLSDRFIQDEITYYRANQSRELPVEMSAAILSCLERARASGVLDWDCFKWDFSQSSTLTAVGRNLPWMAPPITANAVSLAGTHDTNLACLHLSLKWTGQNYGGAVEHARRPGGLPGETVLTEGQKMLWAFDAVVRLANEGQTLFEKEYPREEWRRTYATIYEQPLWKTSQAVLQDLATGLKAKPVPVSEPGKTKPRKHSQAAPGRNAAH